jgi:DNA ligase-1
LKEELARVEALGGEGLMLRKPGSRYEVGRSFSLLKVKTFHDAEARVIEHLPGEGKHKGRLGALSAELGDGTKFSVGTGFSDAQRENPPPVGSIITFRYQELSDRGVPRFPSFVRLRTDVQELPFNLEHVPAAGKSINSSAVAAPSAVSVSNAVPAAAVSSSVGAVAQPAPALRSAATMAVAKPALPQPAPQPAPQAVSAASLAGPARHFEFVEGGSSKFWEISLSDKEVTVKFGRIGTAGQVKPKTFATAQAAKTYHNELIEEKTKKGYKEIGGTGSLDDDDDDQEEEDDE